jgi:hypothetical protein
MSVTIDCGCGYAAKLPGCDSNLALQPVPPEFALRPSQPCFRAECSSPASLASREF